VATKLVDRVHLGSESFAFVGSIEDPDSWKLPVYFPNDRNKTINHIKSALFRFATTKDIPDADRADVWKVIAGAAKAHGLKAGQQPASVAPVAAHPETAKVLDADEQELKEARAVGAMRAERLLQKMGY
jgi:hypothetical protein